MQLRNIFIVLYCFSQAVIGLSQVNVHYTPAEVNHENHEIEEAVLLTFKKDRDRMPEHFSRKQKSYLTKKYLDRQTFSLNMIKSGVIIDNGDINLFLDSICEVILNANPEISRDLKLFALRDFSPNAFTVGDNVVYMQLGLMYRFDKIEQLLFVVCHEIAHNTLEHSRKTQEKYVDEVQNEMMIAKVKSRMQKVYGNVSALNELMIPWLLDNSEYSRKKEYEADSLAMIYYLNLDLDPIYATEMFKILETATHERDVEWKDVKSQGTLASCGHGLNKIQNCYKGSSISRIGLEKEKPFEELLRSHPYEKDRFEKILSDFNIHDDSVDYDETFKDWRYYVENEMIYSSFQNGNLARTLFYIMQCDTVHVDQELANNLLPLSFAILGHEKSKMREGKWLGWFNNEEDKVYKDFYTYLRKLSPDQCMDLSECLSGNMTKGIYKKYYDALHFGHKEEFENFKILYQELREEKTKFHCFSCLTEVYDTNKLYWNNH